MTLLLQRFDLLIEVVVVLFSLLFGPDASLDNPACLLDLLINRLAVQLSLL